MMESSTSCWCFTPAVVLSGKFLADNIVGSVVVFSLVFWIPLSILVHCVVRNVCTSVHTLWIPELGPDPSSSFCCFCAGQTTGPAV